MVTTGHFRLHARAVPPLPANDYVLRGEQSVEGGVVEPYEGHVRVTSPRFRLPPDQILSTYPPANSEGAFENRLPQIVIKRRTLPWSRVPAPDADRKIPWLAVVVIAEGEGSLSAERPVSECVSPGVTLTGPNDVAAGVYLAVPESIVAKTFPTVEDLPLLAHMREVDIDDTELAMGDDDGFLAVVMANRLPQYDRQHCRPVRYMACLVNLEGQLDVLPDPADVEVEDDFTFTTLLDLNLIYTQMEISGDKWVMGTGKKPAPSPKAVGTNPIGDIGSAHKAAPTSSAKTAGATWLTAPATVAEIAVSANPEVAAVLVRDAMKTGFRLPIEHLVPETVYRFPVLAHWSFTVTGAGSFETLMEGLDVGLLGTEMADPAARPRPDCAPPPGGTAAPPAPPARPDPELAETGHVGLGHVTRRGDPVRAWYRGPLGPHLTVREKPDSKGRLPMAHVSDQLRRIVPDGREDLSLAAAFEIGRLLALAEPAVVAALMRWRREQFGAERARQLVDIVVKGLGVVELLEGKVAAHDLGNLLARSVVLAAAEQPAKVFGPNRPLTDKARPLTYVRGDLADFIATGFALPVDEVRKGMRQSDVVTVLNGIDVPVAAAGPEGFDTGADGLQSALDGAVHALAADVMRSVPKSGGRRDPSASRRSRAQRDALDELLAVAARRRAQEVDG